MFMSKKAKDRFFTFGLVGLVIAIGFAIGTYAYYQTTVSGSIGGTVLTWNCDEGNSGVEKSTFANMYPGASGTITFNVRSSITSDYTIKITGFSNMNSGTRANLKLYTDSGHSTVITTSTNITGSVSTNGGTSSKTIYYYWPYGTAESYTAAAPSFTYTITCTQK